ncbi:MAG: CRISPR-associated protein Csx16 [Methylovulum sp.]|nr:MAG: CRISPR-associated protein Csx16 [Methylovulum sp.]
MTTYFVTRHPGAMLWAQQQGLAVDRQLDHLDMADIKPGDTVIGSLPVNLAAEVCAKQARYIHLILELPFAWRGKELSVDDMLRFGAKLQQYHVNKVNA